MSVRRFTVPIAISADPSSDQKYELYQVKESKVIVREIELVFQSGTFNVLFASLYYGNMKIAPRVSEYTLISGVLRDRVNVPYFRGDKILLRVRNTDTTNTYNVAGSLELEEVVE